MSPVIRPSAAVDGSALAQLLRDALGEPDLDAVDWAALHRSIMAGIETVRCKPDGLSIHALGTSARVVPSGPDPS